MSAGDVGGGPTTADLAWGATWPGLDGFRTLTQDRRVVPVVRRLLADDVTPVGLYRRLAQGRPGTFILESAEVDGRWSRYSFVGVSSIATLTVRDGRVAWQGEVPAGVPTEGEPLDVLSGALEVLRTPSIAGLPPLTSGLVGSVGWDFVRQWEPNLPRKAAEELEVPELTLCLAVDLAVVDHVDGVVWLVANAINVDGAATGVDEAYEAAVSRLDAMQRALAEPAAASSAVLDPEGAEPAYVARSTPEEYAQTVRVGKAAIRDGEVFQVVLSQRLDIECAADPLDVYRVLRTINPSPYLYYVQLRDEQGVDFAVVGSSPETLVKVTEGRALTYPIAGSRPRGASPEEDVALAEDLLADPKERSEHIMLVDLSRNDMTKVCEPDSVEVVEFMAVRRFSHITHLCSTVVGTLREDATALDTLRATFPAGTLSGAPKRRAIELIDELEPARRGTYGGTVGYFDFAGDMDMAIAIRTALIRDGRASVQAGAGIVADSVEELEFDESHNKAAAAVRAVQVAARLRPSS